MAKIREYTGENIIVSYDAQRCIHAEECVHGIAAVFNIAARPWIQPDNGSADELAAVIDKCPTGALYYRRTDGGEEEITPPSNKITAMPNGPIYIHGNVEITLADGATAQETRLALCTCGASENKPFCDNSHLKIGYQSELKIADNRGECDEAASAELLTVRPVTNGPNLLSGSFEISSPDDAAVFCGAKGALCRCGGSGKKPLCDGTHKRNGFQSE